MKRSNLASRLRLCCSAGAIAACLLVTPAVAQSAPSPSPHHSFVVEGDHFALDGEPLQILSGELHYARIPREYWRARVQMVKAMGLNTIATYVFWNLHEPRPGVFDFSGSNDLAAFVRIAQEQGLHVLLRAGPYSCAEWEFGGFPSWLLHNPSDAEFGPRLPSPTARSQEPTP